jgi:membrane protein DedA with SNARE-associated domain
MEQFIIQYGYALLFVGVIVEGETPLVLASMIANQSYLDFAHVICVGFASAILGDQILFLIARYKGKQWLKKSAFLSRRLEKSIKLVQRNDVFVILIMRFLYGLRAIMPALLGLTEIPWKRYFFYNLIGVTTWTAIFSFLGYYLATGTNLLFGDVSLEVVVLICLFSVVLIFAILRLIAGAWKRMKRRDGIPL